MGRGWKLGLLAAGVWIAPQVADACSSFGVEEAIPDTSLTDSEAPAAVGDVDVSITRGRAPDCRLGTCSSSSCDDIGFLQLTFDAPEDDQTAGGDLAYEIEVIEGDAPEGLIPDFVFRSFEGPGQIGLQWGDGATDDQEALDFTIVLRAVDQAGNIGADSEPIVITDPGGKAGCNVAHREPPVALLLLPLFGFAARRVTRRGR